MLKKSGVVWYSMDWRSQPSDLTILSQFSLKRWAKSSHYRNLFVAAMSAVIFVAHADPSSKTEELCRQILSRQKSVYTFDSDYNKNIVGMGARPVNMNNIISLWANLFAAYNE